MARIRVCGVCMQPVADCVCPDEPDEVPEIGDDGDIAGDV
jgi:hypothetical protein